MLLKKEFLKNEKLSVSLFARKVKRENLFQLCDSRLYLIRKILHDF